MMMWKRSQTDRVEAGKIAEKFIKTLEKGVTETRNELGSLISELKDRTGKIK